MWLFKWRYGVSVFFSIIAVVALVTSLIVMSVTKVTANRKINECAFTVTGTVVDCKKAFFEDFGYTVTAVYTIEGEEYETSGQIGHLCDPGQTVEVHYDRFKPSRSYAGNKPASYLVYVSSISVAIASGMLFAGTSLRKNIYKNLID